MTTEMKLRLSSASKTPRTPRHRRVLEVPSSQTPPATPLSTQGTRSWANEKRSPLMERSINRGSPTRLRPEAVSPTKSIKNGTARKDFVSKSGALTPLKESGVTLAASIAGSEDENTFKLPHPRWSQLEQRDVTQHARTQLSTTGYDSMMQPKLGAQIRGKPRVDGGGSQGDEPPEHEVDLVWPIRPSQVSTAATTQYAAGSTIGSHPQISSPPKTSPVARRVHNFSSTESGQSELSPSSSWRIPSSLGFQDIGTLEKEESQRRVTFTQLVPQSLRDASYCIAPDWSQDDDEL